jgi:ADP-ribosylglycohydrolase
MVLGAIVGDIVGSIYEWNNIKTKDFPLFSPTCTFTDDTVLTVAIADALLNHQDYAPKLKEYYHRYPDAGYGKSFRQWAGAETMEPYGSWGNGSAMRVSSIGFAFNTLDTVLSEAERSAAVTHNHLEGIKGAQATAACIFLARTRHPKATIQSYIESTFGYNLSQTIEEIRPHYQFDVSCQGSVPQAIIAFLESTDFEDAIRNAISLGGDSDTIASIAGGIAQAFYQKIPDFIAEQAGLILNEQLRSIVAAFMRQYNSNLVSDKRTESGSSNG